MIVLTLLLSLCLAALTACGVTPPADPTGGDGDTLTDAPANTPALATAPPTPTASTPEEAKRVERQIAFTNSTGADIVRVYVALAGSDERGADVLAPQTFSKDAAVTLTLELPENVKSFDVIAEDAMGIHIVWENLDLLTASDIELKFNGSAATAQVK